GLQQGSQLAGIAQQMGGGAQAARGLLQGLTAIASPLNLAIIGFTTLAAVGIQGFSALAVSSKSLEERMAELTTAFDRYKRSADLAGSSSEDLSRQFGVGATAAQELYAILSGLDRLSVDQKLKSTSDAVRDMLGLMKENNRRGGNEGRIADFFDLGGSGWGNARPYAASLGAFDDAVRGFEKAEGIDAQIAAMQTLLQEVDHLARLKDGITKEEQALIDQLKKQADTLLGIQAIETARAEAKKRQVDQMVTGYRQEADLLAVTAQFGSDSIEVERLKAAQARENLDLRLKGIGVEKGSADWLRARISLSLQLAAQEQAALEARRDWMADQQDRLAAITRETGLIGASNAERLRTNALAEAEVEIRKRKMGLLEAEAHRMRALARAAAEAERDRQRALNDIATTGLMDGYDARLAAERNPQVRAQIEAEKEYARQIAAGADATVAAASAEQVRTRALAGLRQEQLDFLRGQQEAVQQLHLELALAGQTEAVRARVLALVQAEREIQARGFVGEEAEAIRRNALARAELARTIEAQADAWKRVQSAGEDAIDSVLDRLRGGDLKGALSEMLGEIEGMFFDLAVRNPLKNAIFGTDLGTWGDVGGWSGIFGRLSGQNPINERALAAQATAPVQSMSVTAATVMIGGPGVANLLSASTAGAVGGYGMAGSAGLGGSANVQQQVWAFFAAKGLKPHQIAAIMGNVQAESGFNPLAVGDGGAAHGLFQWNDRAPKLFDFIGGQGNLGNVQAQLEFAWQEMMTSESGAFKRLMASNNIYDATHAFTGFERPQGYSANNPTSAMHWDKRLAAAEAAMAKFEGTTLSAQAQLGTLGGGFDTFGTMLAQAFTGGGQGAGGGLFGGILGLIGQGLGIPGFAGGGDHGGGWRIVGENGPELEATGAARIFNATQTREILTSAPPAGRGGAQAMAPTVVAPQVSFVINDHSGQKIETEEGVDDQGRPQVTMTIGRSVAGALSQRGNPLRRAMQSEFGTRPTPRVR
uniref:phage tail tip lysozyme n=1 Tax=uncultured Gemmobacter sp. TaxID=1095917 RepID=UPI002591E900